MKIALNALRVAALALAFTGFAHAGSTKDISNQNGSQGMFILPVGAKNPTLYIYEYHDAYNGGIAGVISQVIYTDLTYKVIKGFTVKAIVQNDTNSTLRGAVICAEFARGKGYYKNTTPPTWSTYKSSAPIIAENPKAFTWRTGNTSEIPNGYVVPTWTLGDIPPGRRAEADMQFSFATPMYTSSTTGQKLLKLRRDGTDVLYNRTDSSRIPSYPIAYPISQAMPDQGRGSNVAVFHKAP